MVDQSVQVMEEHRVEPPTPPVPDWFDESAYLRINPDVASAIAQGAFGHAYEHYFFNGWSEKRSLFTHREEPKNVLIRLVPAGKESNQGAREGQITTEPCYIEAVLYSKNGGLLLVGWLNDFSTPLEYLRFAAADWHYTFAPHGISRTRRRDVELEMGSSAPYSYGFFAFVFLDAELPVGLTADVVFGLSDGSRAEVKAIPRQLDDADLRNTVMTYLAQSDFFGSHQMEAIRLLDGGLGKNIVAYNKYITRRVLSGVCVQYFGEPKRRLRGSIIVCLYGKAEYFFLQHAMLHGRPGFEDYELIYVSNSPELAERLMAEAQAAQLIYGVPVTLVLLPGNAGFGAANNIAANYARTNRITIMNPDIFPYHRDWAARHTHALDQLPADQTRIFGTSLYYDDGSLMHGGMYFEFDTAISMHGGAMQPRKLARVEHYGKGAPPSALEFVRSRPIQAVTGAFISVERQWFEALGGFTEDFVFGHYEDADLCLKSICAGTAPWIHDIRMWHLEGKGSTRLPVHEGGSLVNRWIFTERWSDLINNGLEGQHPTHPLMQMPAPEAAPEPSVDLPQVEARNDRLRAGGPL